jgi:hypothetical protein
MNTPISKLISAPNLLTMHPHSENILSGLMLIAMLTYSFSAFSKFFQPGGDQQNPLKLESRIYYSSSAAV